MQQPPLWSLSLPQLCAGQGHEPAQPEGNKISLPGLVEFKAHGGVSRSLDVYLGDFFLSVFHAILSSSGAILKCLKIE